jgi:hypothetical protein
VDQSDYITKWRELWEEKNLLMGRRTDLETELGDINTQVKHLTEVLNHLAPLAGVPVGNDLSGLGITDAIQHVLEHSANAMSPSDVREALTRKGFDLSGHSAPMSSIYKILGRLAGDATSKIVREEADGGRVFYRHTSPDVISDDDIPF